MEAEKKPGRESDLGQNQMGRDRDLEEYARRKTLEDSGCVPGS